MKPLRLILLVLIACIASGCASTSGWRVDVSSYTQWPEAKKPQTFAFERLPSQQSQLQRQTQLEAAALPALQSAGFEWESDANKADVLIQLSTNTAQLTPQVYPTTSFSIGQYWGSRRHGGGLYWAPSFGLNYAPTRYEHSASLLIRQANSNQILYETSASITTYAPDANQWPVLFTAMLKDFPKPAISPRTVIITEPSTPAIRPVAEPVTTDLGKKAE